MGLKENFKELGRDFKKLGKDIGKTAVKTVKTGVNKASDWADDEKKQANEAPAEEQPKEQ